MRDYLDLRTLTFRLRPGDKEGRRLRCQRCRHPVALVGRGRREIRINADGSPHARSCPNTFARRRASLDRRTYSIGRREALDEVPGDPRRPHQPDHPQSGKRGLPGERPRST
jgi:hypothetical protein